MYPVGIPAYNALNPVIVLPTKNAEFAEVILPAAKVMLPVTLKFPASEESPVTDNVPVVVFVKKPAAGVVAPTDVPFKAPPVI